jgi:energy-coupling factor transport system ATP-binding protein
VDTVIVEGLSYAYGHDSHQVLQEISFTLKKEEIVALTGLSGCGKSTLCSCLNGIIPHYYKGEMTGNVIINGKNTREMRVADLAREVGTVLQDPDTQLFMPTVEDEIAFPPENMCLPPQQIRRRVKDVLDLLGINHLASSSPDKLSGGQKQLVALGAVLALDPPVLVLDEAMSRLDMGEKKKIRSVLQKLRQKGKSIIMVEHDMDMVKTADRMIVLEKGHLTGDDSPEKVYRQEGESEIKS